jgi:predicted transcriptional regulator
MELKTLSSFLFSKKGGAGLGLEFDYFYKRDLERFQFFMLPKILVTGEQFKTISSDAKILYACLFDRISLSAKNDWLDKEGRIYIIFTIEEIMKTINRSRPTAVKALDELDKNTRGIGLIERKRLGFGKPNIIYVKDFTSYEGEKLENQTSRSKDIELQEVKKFNYRSKETELQEVKKVDPTNTNYIKTDYIKTDYIKTDFNQEQKAFGAFQNVFLSNKELSNLKTILSNQLDNYIQRLSSYLKSTGRTYEDHEATILSWFYKDQGQQTRSEKSNIPSLEEYERGEHL